MQFYAGVKIIKARPLSRIQYNEYRGWTLPEDEEHLANEPGMLVEYLESGRPNVANHNGYVSWSPLDVFNRAYKGIDSLPFGTAVELLRAGFLVRRNCWDEGVYLQYVNPYAPHPADVDDPGNANPGRLNALFRAADNNKYAPGTMLPWIGITTAGKKFVPWHASQTDILENDWTVTMELA